MIKEICNATGNLARFPAPFSSDLPGLFVACDDGHETYPFAPGVATSAGRGERGHVTRIGVQGSRVRHHRHRSLPPTIPTLRRPRAGPPHGSRFGRMIREPARRSTNARSSKDTNTVAANSLPSPLRN